MVYGGIAAPVNSAPAPAVPTPTPLSTGAYQGVGANPVPVSAVKQSTTAPFSAPLFGSTAKTPAGPAFQTTPQTLNKTPAPAADSAGGILNNTVEGLPAATGITAPPSQSIDPEDWLNAGADSLGSSLSDFKDKMDTWSSDTATNASGLQRLSDGGQAAIAGLGVLFSPVTTVLATLSKVPVVGYLADGVNDIFTALGTGGSDTALAALNALPVSDATKTKLKPLVSQMGGLAAQLIAGGGIGDEAVSGLLDKSKELTKTVADATKDPETIQALQQHQPPEQAIKALPVKEADTTKSFSKSSATPEIISKINTQKVTDMHPTLREEIRNSVTMHGELATHAALKEQLGAGDRQASSLIREAPTPQNAAEELSAHQGALRTAVGQEHLSPDQMSVIKAGPKASSEVPSIDIDGKNGDPNNLGGGVKLVPEEGKINSDNAISSKTTSETIIKQGENTPEVKSNEPEVKPKTIERPVNENGERVTKAANDINEKLVNKGLEQLTPEQQSKYTTGSYKDSLAQAKIMAKEDRTSLNKMATTGEGIPEGLHRQILFNTVELLAGKEGDVELLRKLASSPLGTKSSEAGSELGSHGFNDNPNSAVRKIQDVSKSREDAFEKTNKGQTAKKAVKDTISELKKVKKASAPKIKDWNTFIKSIQC